MFSILLAEFKIGVSESGAFESEELDFLHGSLSSKRAAGELNSLAIALSYYRNLRHF